MTKSENQSNKYTGEHSKPQAYEQVRQGHSDNFIRHSQRIIATFIALLLLTANFAFKHPDPHYAVWLSCVIAELIILELFLYLFRVVNSKKYIYTPLSVLSLVLLLLSIFLPNKFIPDLEKPIFSEHIEHLSFSLGEGGISVSYDKDTLKKPKEPFYLYGYKPVKMYVENGTLYADVNIYGGSGFPPIEIKQNKLFNKPHNWDFNSNDKALEIVGKNKKPIYQFFYKTPSHIVMNGVFPIPNGLILATESGAIFNPVLPTTFSLKRIFKYPAWIYPGEYEE